MAMAIPTFDNKNEANRPWLWDTHLKSILTQKYYRGQRVHYIYVGILYVCVCGFATGLLLLLTCFVIQPKKSNNVPKWTRVNIVLFCWVIFLIRSTKKIKYPVYVHYVHMLCLLSYVFLWSTFFGLGYLHFLLLFVAFHIDFKLALYTSFDAPVACNDLCSFFYLEITL